MLSLKFDSINRPCWWFTDSQCSWVETIVIVGGDHCNRSKSCLYTHVNTLRPGQNGRHVLDDIFKCIFLNENVWILSKISLKFVPKGPINTIQALVQIMAWCRSGNKPLSELTGAKPLSEPLMVSLLPHVCKISSILKGKLSDVPNSFISKFHLFWNKQRIQKSYKK